MPCAFQDVYIRDGYYITISASPSHLAMAFALNAIGNPIRCFPFLKCDLRTKDRPNEFTSEWSINRDFTET
jgi:hypothetical protein